MEEYDLIIIGSGAGMNIVDQAVNAGQKVALIENGPLGGTCLNRGCIPSKMWVYPADVIREIGDAEKIGIKAKVESIDFDVIRRRTWDLVLKDRNQMERAVKEDPRMKWYATTGRFVGDKTLQVFDTTIHAPKVVISAGARTHVPPIPGLDGVPYLTSENLFDITKLPASIILLGGGYKSCEFGHFFSAMGVDTSIIQRNVRLVPDEEPEISFVVAKKLSEYASVSLNQVIKEIRKTANGIAVVRTDRFSGETIEEEAEALFIGTGMQSNSDLLNVQAAGVQMNAAGYILVNDYLETNVPGIWALGDITGRHMYRHTANYESQVVWYNMNGPGKSVVDEHAIPHAIYTYPTVGSVGLTEADAKANGLNYLVGINRYINVAKGNAMADDFGLVKVIVEKGTRRILGAHIVGKEADVLVQQIVYLMNCGDQSYLPMAHSQIIHPALSEVLIGAMGRLREPEGPQHKHVHAY
ncbi:MAG: dihydrolipoyl dehydrogenase [Candidatus Saccharibacteria bacterium]